MSNGDVLGSWKYSISQLNWHAKDNLNKCFRFSFFKHYSEGGFLHKVTKRSVNSTYDISASIAYFS